MMLCKPLRPRNSNGNLRVIILGRITQAKQDPDSITSQHEDAESWLHRVYQGPCEVQRLGEQASGWLPERDTMTEAERLVKTGQVDVVLAAELRETFRNPALHWAFTQKCIDSDVRFILIADGVDTADENWDIMMHAASLRAGMAVPEARRRVRRKATFTFARGGMVLKVKYGYRKLTREEAASGKFGTVGLRIAKLPECTAIILRMKDDVVVRGFSPARVAEWLIDEGIPPGAYVTGGRWTGRLVDDLLRDPILSGKRRFRNVFCKPVYSTGKHRRLPNEENAERKDWPELAHMTSEQQAEMIAALDARKGGQTFISGPEHPLWNRPRSQSHWPGQHANCAACEGRMHSFGKYLKCSNAMPDGPRTCWNHVLVPCKIIVQKVLPWVLSVLDQHPQSRQWITEWAWTEIEERRQQKSLLAFDKKIAVLKKEARRLAKAIRKTDELPSLITEVAAVEAAIKELERQKALDVARQGVMSGFDSLADVAERFDECMMQMAKSSLAFADLLRKLIPVFTIELVQALDCHLVRPRGKLTLRLDHWIPQGETPFEATVGLDLFEPPVHILHLNACVAAKRANPRVTLREIAKDLNINYMTVKRALAYARLMENERLTTPYRVLTAKPLQASRWEKRTPKR